MNIAALISFTDTLKLKASEPEHTNLMNIAELIAFTDTLLKLKNQSQSTQPEQHRSELIAFTDTLKLKLLELEHTT